MHYDKTLTGPKEVTEMIQFYNDTKSRVDIMDKCDITAHRRTNRCPQSLFLNVVNIVTVAAYTYLY